MSRSEEDRALDCIAHHLKDQGFPWDDERDRKAVKHALLAVHQDGYRVRIDKIPPPSTESGGSDG